MKNCPCLTKSVIGYQIEYYTQIDLIFSKFQLFKIQIVTQFILKLSTDTLHLTEFVSKHHLMNSYVKSHKPVALSTIQILSFIFDSSKNVMLYYCLRINQTYDSNDFCQIFFDWMTNFWEHRAEKTVFNSAHQALQCQKRF